jgi:hypothetical protein
VPFPDEFRGVGENGRRGVATRRRLSRGSERSGCATATLPLDDDQERRTAVLLLDASSSGRPTVTPASAGLLDAKSEDQRLMA